MVGIVIMQDWNDWEWLGSMMGMKVMTDGNCVKGWFS